MYTGPTLPKLLFWRASQNGVHAYLHRPLRRFYALQPSRSTLPWEAQRIPLVMKAEHVVGRAGRCSLSLLPGAYTLKLLSGGLTGALP